MIEDLLQKYKEQQAKITCLFLIDKWKDEINKLNIKPMTLTETLLKNISVGKYVVVRNEYNEYCIFSPHKDIEGDYRRSSWEKTIKGARENIGSQYGISEDGLNRLSKKYNWAIHEIYTPEYEIFKVGDEVCVEGQEGLFKIIQQFYNSDKGYYILDNNISYWHTKIYYPYKTTPTQEEQGKAIKVLEEAGRVKDGKIIIK